MQVPITEHVTYSSSDKKPPDLKESYMLNKQSFAVMNC